MCVAENVWERSVRDMALQKNALHDKLAALGEVRTHRGL